MTATTSAPPLDPDPTPYSNAPTPDGDDVNTELSKDLHRQFLEHAAIANWSSWRLMVLIRQMEACQGYRNFSCKTLADYLVLMCGFGNITARQRIRVAEALAQLPAIEGEFAAGRLSYAKVRALVRIATPETDRDWADRGKQLTADDLEAVAARCRKGTKPARRLLTAILNETTSRMIVDLPSEEMELITQALERVRKEAGEKLSASEALLLLCADSLSGELGKVRTADRYQVVVHVGEDGKTWAETASGPAPIKPEVMQRLLCDCSIRIAKEGKNGVAGVSRAQRTISAVTRKAIEIRDGHRCRVPGCKRKIWLDIHHALWWIRGGRHDLANLFLLCAYHHRQHHDGLLRIRPGAKRGEWIFEAVAGWILGDDGQLTRDWSSDEHPETFPWDEIDPFTAALKDTPWEERLQTFGRRRRYEWTVREEPAMRYGAGTIPRNRDVSAGGGRTIPRNRGGDQPIPRNRPGGGQSAAEAIPRNRGTAEVGWRRFPGIVGSADEGGAESRYVLKRFGGIADGRPSSTFSRRE